MRAARRRWIVTVTIAESCGYLLPAIAGIASARMNLTAAEQAALMAAAGFGEGFVLGMGQARAFDAPVRRLRFALLTGAGACLVWASVMLMMVAGNPLAFAPLAAVVGLFAIGGAQWLELRHHRAGARAWIGWTALAWVLALPLSFAPSPLVDEHTPLAIHVLVWPLGGVLMALVMATVTWQGVRRLRARQPPSAARND